MHKKFRLNPRNDKTIEWSEFRAQELVKAHARNWRRVGSVLSFTAVSTRYEPIRATKCQFQSWRNRRARIDLVTATRPTSARKNVCDSSSVSEWVRMRVETGGNVVFIPDRKPNFFISFHFKNLHILCVVCLCVWRRCDSLDILFSFSQFYTISRCRLFDPDVNTKLNKNSFSISLLNGYIWIKRIVDVVVVVGLVFFFCRLIENTSNENENENKTGQFYSSYSDVDSCV